MFEASNRILAVLCGLAVCASAAVDQCKPIGWATRSGRTSTEFNVTGGGNALAGRLVRAVLRLNLM